MEMKMIMTMMMIVIDNNILGKHLSIKCNMYFTHILWLRVRFVSKVFWPFFMCVFFCNFDCIWNSETTKKYQNVSHRLRKRKREKERKKKNWASVQASENIAVLSKTAKIFHSHFIYVACLWLLACLCVLCIYLFFVNSVGCSNKSL